MTTSIRLLCALVFIFAATGCGKVALNLDGLNPAALGPNALAAGAEFISSVQSGTHSVNGYTPTTATGGVFSSVKSTTANGYVVYSGIQGMEISDQE